MGALNTANIKKTIYYLQRNGLKNTWHAVRERMSQAKESPYIYEAPSKEELARQRQLVAQSAGTDLYDGIDFSIVVPLYRTKPEFLRDLVESILAQTYPDWELVLADATEDDSVETLVKAYEGEKAIRYVHLPSNDGISANTNAALPYATKKFIGLLDHDDILTPDALFEMAEAIRRAREQGQELQLIYSDEDKCNGDASEYYEPHYKEDFNYDLILSNNYICHFLVMRRELMQKLMFRPAYDGAQDYDLVLRAVAALGVYDDPKRETFIGHVPKVLYHWRCHVASTAENPRSKEYAYEAGKRALQDYMDSCHIKCQAVSLKHVGFYGVEYTTDVFEARPDLGIIGGPIILKGQIAGGRMDASGDVFYEGLDVHYSGYLHRAVLTQSAEAVDIRCMAVREELWDLFEETTGTVYKEKDGSGIFDAETLPSGSDYKELSLRLCAAVRARGYRILWHRRDYE